MGVLGEHVFRHKEGVKQMLPVAMLGVGIECSVLTVNQQRGFGSCCRWGGGAGLSSSVNFIVVS